MRPATLAMLVILSGCGVTLVPGRPTTPHDGAREVDEHAAMRCIHGTPGRGGVFRGDLEGPETDLALAPFLEPFDPRVRRTAVAAGLEPLLARVMRERQRIEHGTGSEEDLLSMRDELSARMFALETQLLAMEFEVDCVRALLADVIAEHEEAETDRQVAWTIASLVVAAGTSIASSLWDVGNTAVDVPLWEEGPFWTAILGSVATAAVGAGALVPGTTEVVYLHEHNVLAPIQAGEDPGGVYPTFIFRMLTLPTPGGGPSPRDELVSSFDAMIEAAVSDDREDVAREIVFGPGGIHDVALLELAADLLEELGAALDALAQDVDVFGSSIAIVLATDDLGSRDVSPEAEAPGEAEPPSRGMTVGH